MGNRAGSAPKRVFDGGQDRRSAMERDSSIIPDSALQLNAYNGMAEAQGSTVLAGQVGCHWTGGGDAPGWRLDLAPGAVKLKLLWTPTVVPADCLGRTTLTFLLLLSPSTTPTPL